MSAYRSSLAADRQYPDCPGCGRDLNDLENAIFCPGCGRQLQFRTTVRERLASAGRSLFRWITFHRFSPGSEPAAISPERAPITIGYSNAMFKLGWYYERGGRNVREATRCYRKSARLGNTDAKVRLAAERRRQRDRD